jgi:phosphatidylinositol alpha-mannosyltransferase
MKIALVSPYDFAYPGGVTNHICSLAHHLTRMGHTVKVIAPASKAATDFDGMFLPVGRPRAIPASGSIARITISPRLSPEVKAILNQEHFDIVHLHEPLCPMLCTTVLRLSPAINVGTFHAFQASPSYNFGKPFTTILLKKWFRKLHGRIAVSKAAMEFVHGHFPSSYKVIPNGIDLDHFSPDVSPIDDFGDGKVNILFVGRMEKRKGLNHLLRAYKAVKQQFSNSRLIVVGPGTRLRRKYEKMVRHDGLKDVVFVGYVPYDELPRYYKTADVFCAPATGSESFGIVLLEAMALGKPVVASSIDGYASVVTHGVEGLLVPPKDEAGMARALVSLVTDERARQQMGAGGRLRAEEFSWEHIAQSVSSYYVSVLNESSVEARLVSV